MSAEATIFLGTGRRKTATARVRLQSGTGKIVINDREVEKYFPTEALLRNAVAPLLTVEQRDKVDIAATVTGSGPNGQAGAVAHGIARALQKMNIELRVPLKKAGHITRDPREKERKKAGQPGARKRFQFSKR